MTSHRSYYTASRVSQMNLVKHYPTSNTIGVATGGVSHRIIEWNDATHLLLPTLIARTLHRLSPLVIASIVILRVIDAPRGAVDPRNGDIPLATLEAIGGHGERRMIDSRHYGTDGS